MNKNLEEVRISGIRKFYNEVQKVEGAISLTLGQPDFQMPEVVKKALVEAVENNKTTYTENSGILELRTEISKYLNGKNINYNPNDICVTVGGSEALFTIFTALINEGDKVLIPTPAYPAYESIVKILGGKVVNYSLNDDFTINVEEIKEFVEKEKIKYLVLSLPSNPTGAILSKEEKESLIKIIKDNDLTVISDEIYEALCYDEYNTVAQDEDVLEKLIYINGFSKMLSMTGLRVGYFACKKEMMNELMKVHQYNVSCAPSISQWAVIGGLRNGLDDVIKMKSVFEKRREFVVNELKAIGLDVIEPKGAFYVFPSIKKFNISSEEFCLRLLHEHKVACVPGSAFGKGGEGYIRISYCYSDEQLKMALIKIKDFINML
jgi:aminotransferase